MEKGIEFRLCDYNPLVLAYMGDSYYELLIRERLVRTSDCLPAVLNERAKEYVTARRQSNAVNAILPHLCEKEVSVFKAGRNAKSPHTPKSSAVGDYRRATGLECLFGYLYLSGQTQRALELIEIIIVAKEEKCND